MFSVVTRDRLVCFVATALLLAQLMAFGAMSNLLATAFAFLEIVICLLVNLALFRDRSERFWASAAGVIALFIAAIGWAAAPLAPAWIHPHAPAPIAPDAVAPELLSRERRDILSVHESLADFAAGNDALEISESVPTGAVLLAHMVKARSVVHRGQRAEALVQDGMMSVRTQVDILEDGAPGDTVRARNVVTHRDLSGTVLNQRTILVSL